MAQQRAYPLTFSVDYPDRDLSRLSTVFRLVAAIPILILLGLLTGTGADGWFGGSIGARFGDRVIDADMTNAFAGGGGLLFLPPLLMLLFRKKYPGWWADWNRELLRFANRVGVYLALMDDRYPSTDEQQAVRLDFPQPDGARLSRWLPLVKWLLAIPHYLVLFFLGIAAVGCVVVAWVAILVTGRYPRGLFGYVEGVMRWSNRVTAYAFVLVTDEYPPFSLDP
jgi:hypothetical protein